ncbi:MAG: Polyribonucleotide nucleotidyltransferase [Deltaproteobacteria bacterium ADurb.Bin510]|nr:MAG: Polyribonucleotide nucleotidyltransferase [Deltaproteobacteria bacterium ADurb.Bin510]
MTMRVQAKGTGTPLIFDVGTVARQADGSVLVYQGDSVVLVTAQSSKEARPGTDFLPLTVEYQEMSYAAGRIKGGFVKRDGRPGVQEILTARCIDRPIRPLFPKNFYNEIQVIAMVMSADPECNPDIMAINGASAALHISSIPFAGPIGACRVGRIDGQFVIDPSVGQLEDSELELVVVGTKDAIVMVEGEAQELSEDVVLAAIEFAHIRIREVIEAIEELRAACGKEKMVMTPAAEDAELLAEIKAAAQPAMLEVIKAALPKHERAAGFSKIKEEVLSRYAEDPRLGLAKEYFGKVEKSTIRGFMQANKLRVDGRTFDEIRPITCATGLLPRTHGSALFTRGETQAMAITTLGTSGDEQRVETLLGETTQAFMLHYQFPPFSVGEVRMLRGPGRREIGHGNLAERAIKPILPPASEFPYTIRLVSEILESNGSSSMASVCGGCLALMDAGVPIKKPVAGIAMGLIKEGDDFMVLTDILGDEDHLGDMDFKVTGTKDGVTALQMDIKVEGITPEIMKVALEQAKEGRLHILGEMNKVLATPREKMSEWAPSIITIKIDPEKIRDVIGKGGAVIRQITEETGTTIDIENDGTVKIASVNGAAGREAQARIELITADVEVGRIYEGRVARLMDFGAFVTILPGRDGLVHISQISDERVERVSDKLNEGDVVRVRVLEVDRQGRVRLSMKDV